MTSVSISRHFVDHGVLRLAVTGEIDLSTSELLVAAVRDAIAVGQIAELVVDLGKVTFLDSTGISALVAGRNLAGERGVAYVVINPHDMVRRVLDVAGVLATLTGQS